MNCPKKKCQCGKMMDALDWDDDRAWYPSVCSECEASMNQKCSEFAKILAESSEPECMRYMSYITIRLEYLKKAELQRLAEYHAN